MTTGLYLYTTDRGTQYTVRIDKALGDNPAFGFIPAVSPMPDSLPRKMVMRSIGCSLINGRTRQFAVGKSNAPILTIVLPFFYKGVQCERRRYKPEKSSK